MSLDLSPRSRAAGFVLAGVGAAMFSTKAIFIKLAYVENPDASLMLALRMIVSLPLFAAIGIYAVRAQRRSGIALPGRRGLIGAACAGFIGYYLAMILDFQGLVYISAQLERLVLFTYPLLIMVLGAMFFGGRITRHGPIAAAITYLGLAFVFGADFRSEGWNTALGAGLVLASAIAFAFYQLFAKAHIANMGSLLFTSIALSSASVACILHYVVVSGGFDFSASQYFWLLAAATGLVATVIPNFLINAGIANIGTQAVAMLSTLSPLLTIWLAVVFLGESFGLADAAGTTLVLVGIGYYLWADSRAIERP